MVATERFTVTHDIIESLLDDGYYALRVGDTGKINFFRISRPQKGAFKDSFKVQTQHSDLLKLALVHYRYLAQPYNAAAVRVFRYGVEKELLEIVSSKTECQLLYALETHHCFQCGKRLTDERSRWYGFGPDCEKDLGYMKMIVEEQKGSTYENRQIVIPF